MVIIQNRTNVDFIDEGILSAAMQTVLLRFNKTDSELVVRLVTKNEIQQLNKTYRGQNKPTNVLAFPSNLPLEVKLSTLGDVVICVDVVKQESQTQNKNFTHHLIHIAVHGVLHLLGYDHIESKDAELMEGLEIDILAKIQINNPYQ